MAESASGEPSQAPPNSGDLAYDAFYGAAVGGAVLAFFFLAVDVIAGRALYTPSMLGQALFEGADPASVEGVRLEMVAYFTVVHLVSFLVLGGVISFLCQALGIAKTTMPLVTAVVFVILTAAFFAGDLLLMQGVAQAIGIPLVLAANLVTALAMAFFLRQAHAED